MMYAVLFLVGFCVNFFYAMYVRSISQGKMLRAAIYGECIVVSGAVITINYVNNHYYLIASVFGGFFGTLLMKKICSFFNIKI